jgi:hypothetical protein
VVGENGARCPQSMQSRWKLVAKIFSVVDVLC